MRVFSSNLPCTIVFFFGSLLQFWKDLVTYIRYRKTRAFFFSIQILDVNGRRRLCPFFGDWNVSYQILTLHSLLEISYNSRGYIHKLYKLFFRDFDSPFFLWTFLLCKLWIICEIFGDPGQHNLPQKIFLPTYGPIIGRLYCVIPDTPKCDVLGALYRDLSLIKKELD